MLPFIPVFAAEIMKPSMKYPATSYRSGDISFGSVRQSDAPDRSLILRIHIFTRSLSRYFLKYKAEMPHIRKSQLP